MKMKDKTKAFIQEYVGDSFYNFHFVIFRNHLIYKTKEEKDLKDLFSEFITIIVFKTSCSRRNFTEDVERYIDDKMRKYHQR